MNISNETKIGVMAAIAITLLILGFNFLKGKNLFASKHNIYAVFEKVEALNTSDPVKMNGLQIGSVSELEEKDANVTGIIVGIHITRNVNIPNDSYALINASPLGSTEINIVPGTSTVFLGDDDTLVTKINAGMIAELKNSLTPVLGTVDSTLQTLDSVLTKADKTLDSRTRANLQATIAHLAVATSALSTLLHPKQGDLAQSLQNLNSMTGNLRKNNDSINAIVQNLGTISRNFSALELDRTLSKLDATADQLNLTLKKINSGDGTMGLLMNDPRLYNNLMSTSNSLNVLLQDFRLHPKRYVNVSVFGKKDKSGPLMQPLPDTTTKVPRQ